MNTNNPQNCERIEALLPAFAEGDLAAADAASVRAHVQACDACREALAAFTAMEVALVSRRDEVPPAVSFLPDLSTLRAAAPAASRDRVDVTARSRRVYAHPRLVAALRALTSPAGVAAVLVVWAAMFLLRYRDTVGEVFTWTSLDRMRAMSEQISGSLVAMSGGDVWALSAIYLAVALAVLASTGALTLRFLRNH